MIGQLKDLTINRDGSQNITVTVTGDFRASYDGLRGKTLDIDIKAHRNRRSLDANAYCWVLVDKIAEAMHYKKEEVYKNAIRDVPGVSEIICVQNKAVDRLREGWQAHGLGWQTDTLPSQIKGCTNVILYYGSSTFDTKQMSALIDSLIQDAEGLGIETITPAEKERLLRQYGRKNEGKADNG